VSATDCVHSAVTSDGNPSGAADQSHRSVEDAIMIEPVVPSIIAIVDGAFARPTMFHRPACPSANNGVVLHAKKSAVSLNTFFMVFIPLLRDFSSVTVRVLNFKVSQ
jgi:hypothetical protein